MVEVMMAARATAPPASLLPVSRPPTRMTGLGARLPCWPWTAATHAGTDPVALILLQGLPLTWRRHRPLVVFGVVLAANTAYYAIGSRPSQFDFGLPVAVFTVAVERDRR